MDILVLAPEAHKLHSLIARPYSIPTKNQSNFASSCAKKPIKEFSHSADNSLPLLDGNFFVPFDRFLGSTAQIFHNLGINAIPLSQLIQ